MAALPSATFRMPSKMTKTGAQLKDVPHIETSFFVGDRYTGVLPSMTGRLASRASGVASSGYRRLRVLSPFTRSVANWNPPLPRYALAM